MQESVRIKITTLWVSDGHPACNKGASNGLNLIHNHTQFDLNIQALGGPLN